jgi:hypothetical protein
MEEEAMVKNAQTTVRITGHAPTVYVIVSKTIVYKNPYEF